MELRYCSEALTNPIEVLIAVRPLSVCALLRNTDFLGAPRIVSLNRLPRRPAAWAGPGVGLGVEHYMM